MALFPLDYLTFSAILMFTFLFDLVDLNPQIGSFSFLKSSTYYTYFSLRLAFGTLAGILLQSTGLFENSLLLAFGAVVTAVSTLENFTLNIAGESIVDLPSLFSDYRKRMIENELERASQKELAKQMRLVYRLSSNADKDTLRKHSVICLRALHREEEKAMEKVNEKIAEIERVGGTDEILIRTLFAIEIVDHSPDYAEKVLREH